MNLSMELLDLYVASCKSKAKKNRRLNKETATFTHAIDTVTIPVNPDQIEVLELEAPENFDLINTNEERFPK